MDSLPPGAVPVDQFQAEEPAAVQAPMQGAASTHPDAPPEGAIPIDAFESQDDHYGTTGQQAIAGLEGVAKGVAGPLATGAERLLGVQPEDIRGRAEANPITHGVGEATGLVGGALTGTGEAAVMAKVGEGAAALAGLGKVAEGASLGYRVGSEAVKQAAEMAVLQSGDEVSKMIVQDPEASTESAIANVGLASALGGATGAAFAGIISPLWKASVGDKLDSMLGGLKNHLSGNSQVVLPEAIDMAFKDIGHEPSDLMRAALSGDPKATMLFQDLYRGEHPEVMAELKSLPSTLRDSVAEGLGVPLEDAQVFSKAQSGEEIRNKTIDTITNEYGPLSEELDRLQKVNATIQVPDEERLKLTDRIYERALSEDIGTDSPVYKHYEEIAQRVLSKDTIKGIDSITSDLGKLANSHTTDPLTRNAYNDLRQMLNDFKESQISKQAIKIGEDMVDPTVINRAEKATSIRGVGSAAARAADEAQATADKALAAGRQEGKDLGAKFLNERADANRNYAEYAKKFDTLMDHLGIGSWKGTGALKEKLADLTPEQIIAKFSTKGDAKAQQFLVEHFPEIASMVREHEAKAFLAPSVHDVAGETSLDVKNLAKRLETLKKGSPEHADWVLSKDAQKRIESAKIINDALSQAKAVKDSGTPAGLSKLYRHMGGSALAAVGMLAGHNPIGGYILGEAAHKVGKEAPEAIKLGMLKFLGSDQPIKAEGFKAMVNLVHNTIKGESAIAKSAKAVFKGSAQVLTESQMPYQKDKDKIDKFVSESLDKPGEVPHLADNSHLGHYMPQHQAALTAAQARAVQYLQSIKPQPKPLGPLDKPIPPSKADEARYDRALGIAASPTSVLQHVHDGTLMPSDVQDLKSMYPSLYKTMATKLTNEMNAVKADDNQTSYRTRMALSLFLGQPLDNSMTAMSIQAAQPIPRQPVQPPQGKAKGGAKTANTMLKNAKQYNTQTQAGESDRNGRD